MLAWENFQHTPCEGFVLGGKTAGQGDKLLITIPGYGNDRDWFDGVLRTLPEGWRVACYDLPPFYGSDWTHADPVGPEALRAWLQDAASRFGAREVHVLAFSLGARVAMSMHLAAPGVLRSFILINPDGVRVSPYYAFAMYTRVGNWLFRRILRNPVRFLAILRILYALRLIGRSILHLAQAQFESPARRERLLKAWQMWSGMRPRLAEIAAQSRMHGTRWHVLWGKGDKVLPPRLGRRFCRKVPGAQLHPVEGGHFLVRNPRPEIVSLIQDILRHT